MNHQNSLLIPLLHHPTRPPQPGIAPGSWLESMIDSDRGHLKPGQTQETTVTEFQIPRLETGNPGGTDIRADLYISKPWGTGAHHRPRGTVGDLSITHPLNASGTHPDGTTKVGRWRDTNRHPEGVYVQFLWGAKKSKHSNYFHHGFFMVPPTFGHLQRFSTQNFNGFFGTFH